MIDDMAVYIAIAIGKLSVSWIAYSSYCSFKPIFSFTSSSSIGKENQAPTKYPSLYLPRFVVDLGTLTDAYEKEITIHTTATSKDGEKTILAGKDVTIIDTVKLDGLIKGTKYQLKGWQMLKEENAELIINNKRVENDYTFVADAEAMKVEIAYTFNASALGGKSLVTFEELYDLSNPEEPVKVAEHKDIDDDGQTVLITERIIKIHTIATDKDGKKEIEAGKDVTIVDTVKLEGLEVGTKYQLVGWQMLKDENAELIINDKRVENDYIFTADSETMEAKIEFTFDASSLGGKQLVTFEELYDLSNPDEPIKVTEHSNHGDCGTDERSTFKHRNCSGSYSGSYRNCCKIRILEIETSYATCFCGSHGWKFISHRCTGKSHSTISYGRDWT